IDHPNIIPIYEAGERDGTSFLAMRYVEGTDLATRLRSGPLTPREAVSMLAQVAGALDAAGAAGLVHRDVKPANLLIAASQGVDQADHVYLTDFGLTKERGSETGFTRTGSFLGTLEYVAPEQIEGKPVDGRADQYALAAIAVECLTGLAPYPRDSDLAIVNAHLRDAPPSVHQRRSDLPSAVDAVIARGLAKGPADRYPDSRTFVAELRDALGVTATQPRPMTFEAGRRRMILIVAGASLVVVVLALVAGLIRLAAGGTSAPSVTPSQAAVGGSPSATVENADVFPTAAESELLALLRPELRSACQRGPYNFVEGTKDTGSQRGATPIASLGCPRDIASGASEVVIRQFSPAGATGGDGAFNTDLAISIVESSRATAPGDCATSAVASDRWELNGVDQGALVCYVDPTTGDAILYWSYQDQQILVKASNKRGDSAALYDYFTQVARFIAP
ncbi:MAG TPA: serine/threonine-protein kinase, partial [Candidatus Saccharimonadia bacterium]|nr:serine/threonine-protein kinase [Candidatus Saccharimonadia bacterium]